jgi:hypothetical protein
VRDSALAKYGTAACAAYGVAPGEVFDWWLARATSNGRATNG